MLNLLNNTILDRFGLKMSSQWKEKILQRQRRHPTSLNTSHSINIIDITHTNQIWLVQINFQIGYNFKAYELDTQIRNVFWISPTKYQGVICKQKMVDVKHTRVPRPHRKAWKKGPIYSSKCHFAKGLHYNDKEQGRQRISLSQTTGATEETGGRTIHQTRKVH